MALERTGSARDMAGRKREYETIYIMKPDVSADVLAAVNAKMRSVIEGQGGQLLKIDNWGKRKLAYEVAKNTRGMYLFLSYLGGAGLVDELQRNLRLQDSVIRSYSVKVAENVDPATRTSEVTDESFAQAGTPGPDRDEVVTAPVERPFGDDEEGAFDFEEAVFGELDSNKGGSR